MYSIDDLPKKCYACSSCQKFTPKVNQTNICAICEHYVEQHEQFADFLVRLREHEARNNSVNSLSLNEGRVYNSSDNQISIKDKLQNLQHQININELAVSYGRTNFVKNTGSNSAIVSSGSFTLKVVMFPYVHNNKIITIETRLWNLLSNLGLIKTVTFSKKASAGEVEQILIDAIPVIEETGWRVLRPITSHSPDLVPYRENELKSGEFLKMAATQRKRLYIGPINKDIINTPLQNEPTPLDPPILTNHIINSEESPPILTNDRINSEASVNNISNTSSIDATIDNRTVDEFRTELLRSLQLKYNINQSDTTSIHIKDMDSCVDYLISWGMSVTNEDLLKRPIICLDENVVDTGGVFRELTATFWQRIKSQDFLGGKLFDDDEVCLIQQNETLIEWQYASTIGKLLFWSWIHLGSWPKWLHQIHLQYAINGIDLVMCSNILRDRIPYLYHLVNDIKETYRDERQEDIKHWIEFHGIDDEIFLYDDLTLANFIIEYEIITKRQKSLELLKEGFNVGGSLKVVYFEKMDFKRYSWSHIEKELYLSLDSLKLLNQFDIHQIEMTIAEIHLRRSSRRQIFNWLKQWIRLQPIKILEIFLRFITGTTRIPLTKKITIRWFDNQNQNLSRLPYARTCICCLMLSQNYSKMNDFYDDLNECLANNEEFSEAAYSRIHSSISNTSFNNETISVINNNTETIDLTDRNILNRSTIDNTETVDEIIDLTADQDIEANRDNLAEDESLSDNDIETNIIDLADDDTSDEIAEESHVLDIRSESFQIQGRKRNRRRNINNDSNSNLHQFIEVTPEEILGEQRKGVGKKPKNTRKIKATRATRATRSRTTRSVPTRGGTRGGATRGGTRGGATRGGTRGGATRGGTTRGRARETRATTARVTTDRVTRSARNTNMNDSQSM
ncbi:hypothetical protein RhiirA4_481259 [Rhizophagus irregularis]|uniref:HECT domain-containing protein n=1 Tax=Rhizophagus irregularis TaxID=588596 RepID=A0A2I1HJ94_9GLOM|nr:hypothetical protein RhiirA4_481259 [Rhizophagus irregularis]